MYCPNCASQNNDEAKFCRACGANLSLISQALTGQLPEVRRGRHGRLEHKGPPSFGKGIESIIGGLGFILVAFGARYFAPAGGLWWFYMFIPAFMWIGRGVNECVSAKQLRPPTARVAQMAPPGLNTNDLPPRTPSELPSPPSSVTESTTRLFDESNRQN